MGVELQTRRGGGGGERGGGGGEGAGGGGGGQGQLLCSVGVIRKKIRVSGKDV